MKFFNVVFLFFFFSQISDKGCLLTLHATSSITMTATIDSISYERRIKTLELENRELLQKADRIDGSTSPPTAEESQKSTEQIQILTQQNQGLCRNTILSSMITVHFTFI